VVLIDTAGRSQHDREKLSQLKSFIEAAQPDEVHLVLASTGTQKVLMQAIERFSEVRTDRIIFTKLDEAVSFGVLVNVIRRVNKRLSFVTTGQEVPHQIEPGRGERLAGLILGESL
jgi:flagellar biosynthesis protein FlhF